MRLCISAILVSLTSKGACTDAADNAALAGVSGFLPPVSHIMATMRNASPTRSQDWTFFGRRPWGFCAFSWTWAGWLGWFMVGSSVRGNTTRKRQLLFADGEVTGVDDLGRDVNAVLELERDQVRLAVLDFIESGLFPRAALDVSERVVVVDGGDQERLAASFRVERVVELEFRGVTGAEMVELLGGLDLRRVDLIRRLGAERFQFLLVCFRLASAYISAQPGAHRDARAFFWFDEDFQIGLDVRLVADFSQ